MYQCMYLGNNNVQLYFALRKSELLWTFSSMLKNDCDIHCFQIIAVPK